MKKLQKLIFAVLVVCMAFSSLVAGGKKDSGTPDDEPLEISVYLSDNATLPFREDWITVQEAGKRTNSVLKFEPIPIADYSTKVSLALNTQTNAPDVILYQSTRSENASLALNGAIVAISDYPEWTPHFNAMVEKFGMEADIDAIRLKDGKYYYLPALFDVPFYDGGLILREDVLDEYGFDAPKTFDDLYAIFKAYKEDNPDSYPLTILAPYRVLSRMTMPSWGVSVGRNSSTGTNALSWDYEDEVFFEGAISEEYREYMRFIAKLYSEGLLDPEMAEPIDGDRWIQKMATGDAIASYAYYDQIGGIEVVSKIPGFKLQMYPSLEGPAGAHHQPKSRTGGGIMFPAKTADDPDFERIVRTIDEAFYSEENAKLWCLGVEGVTYTEENGKIVYSDEILASPDGIYKNMQIDYGCGSAVTQMVWVNAQEMTKYDENYARINAEVVAMGNVIQALPPTALFDDLQAEEAGLVQAPLSDAIERWINWFMTGEKSLDTDWDEYVAELKTLGIERFNQMYNDAM